MPPFFVCNAQEYFMQITQVARTGRTGSLGQQGDCIEGLSIPLQVVLHHSDGFVAVLSLDPRQFFGDEGGELMFFVFQA